MSLEPCPCGAPMNGEIEFVVSGKRDQFLARTITMKCGRCGRFAQAKQYYGEQMKTAVKKVERAWNHEHH